jgi:hypothetical protein
MYEYIRANNDFRQRREEAYRYSEMTRDSEEGSTQGMLGRYTIPAKVKTEAITTKGTNTVPSQLGAAKLLQTTSPMRQRGTKLWRKIQLTTKKVVLLVPWRG